MKRFIILLLVLVTAANTQNQVNVTAAFHPSINRQFQIKRTYLKVSTYNIGMLSTDLASVPFYNSRLNRINEIITSYIKKERPSVLFFQELWHGKANREIEKVAQNTGYATMLDVPKKLSRSLVFENSHGLQILLSPDLLNGQYHAAFKPLKDGETYICGFGILCKRGVGYVNLTTNSGNFLFATFHLTPLLSEINRRKAEIKEIIQFLINMHADYIIIGADFNYSLEFENEQGKNNSKWTANSELYRTWIELWNHAGYSCIDNWSSANPNITGYTQDRINNHVAAAGKYTRDEPNQRIDQIWTCGRNLAATEIKTSSLIFKNRFLNYENREIELSDHYGVESELFFYSIERVYTDKNSIASRQKNKIKTAVKNP